MTPASMLGLPQVGLDTAVYAEARNLLALPIVLGGLALYRGHRALALALGCLHVAGAALFWLMALGRPYGVLVTEAPTRWAAGVGVAAASGGADGAVVGVPGPLSTALLARAFGEGAILVPTLLPVLVVPALAVLLALLLRGPGTLAALIFLVLHTDDASSLGRVGLLTEAWARPAAAAVVIVAATLALAVSRQTGRARWLASAVVLAACAASPSPDPAPVLPALSSVLLDPLPWIVLAAAGGHPAWRAAGGLLAGAAAAVMLGATGLPLDVWVGSALFRVGLAAGVAHGLERLLGGVEARLGRAGMGAAWCALLLGGPAMWWLPHEIDPVADASMVRVPTHVAEPMAWIRSHTAADAVFVAGEGEAPLVAVLGGRRVLRAPALGSAPDDEVRRRLEDEVRTGGQTRESLARYGVRYVVTGPDAPPEAWPRYRRIHSAPDLQVFEIPRRDGTFQ
jgi:hypothetical protein